MTIRLSPTHRRHSRLDALRGAAVYWMAIYHVAFDLNHFGFVVPKQRFFFEAFWVWQRTSILSLFLFVAGMSLAVAMARGQSWGGFFKRWWQILAGAALVSIGSWWAFPNAWIWLGVLHAMAAMLLLARLLATWFASWRRGLEMLGLVCLALPWVLRSPAFDAPSLQWIGLGVIKPLTQDWVPLLPWFGVLLLGVVWGLRLLIHRPAWLEGPLPSGMQPLATLGRWSLSFYLLHQPLFFGLMSAVASLR